MVEFGPYQVVDEIKVIDHESETTQIFSIDLKSKYIEYKPSDKSTYDRIAYLNTGEFILYDLSGMEYHFDEYGCISETMTGKEYKVEYEYFEDGIEDFTETPYNLTKASNETVNVEIGDYELYLPKKMSIIDLNQGNTVLFEFVDSDTCVCYVPKDNNSSYKSMHYLTNGYYLAETNTGTKIYFDEGGQFYSVDPKGRNFLKSVKQGDYIAEFNYTIVGDGLPVADKIRVYKDLEWTLVYELTYEYDALGFLVDASMILASNK